VTWTIKEIIEENKNGFLVSRKIDDMVDKIMYLKNNRDIGKEMGERGRQAILSKHNWDNIVTKTECIFYDIYNEVKSHSTYRCAKYSVTRNVLRLNDLLFLI
jgi:glycosyltransferase involved in cell wall biosynthesis